MLRVRTDVPQSLSSTVPLFTSPFVSQSRCSPTLYSPVPMFPSPCLLPRGTPHVSQSLCCPVPLLPSPYPPVPLFHSLDIPHKWFPVPMTVCSPKIFPSPYMFPGPYALQSLCSPVPMLRSPYRLDVPRCLCSPNTVPSPYVPQYMMYME